MSVYTDRFVAAPASAPSIGPVTVAGVDDASIIGGEAIADAIPGVDVVAVPLTIATFLGLFIKHYFVHPPATVASPVDAATLAQEGMQAQITDAQNAATAMYSSMLNDYIGKIGTVTDTLNRITTYLTVEVDGITKAGIQQLFDAVTGLSNWIQQDGTVWIQQLQTQMANVNSDIGLLQTDMGSVFNWIQDDGTPWIQQLQSAVAQIDEQLVQIQQQVTYIENTQITGIESELTAVTNQVTQLVQYINTTVIGDIGNALQQAEAYTDQQVNQAVTVTVPDWIDAGIQQGLTTTWPTIAAQAQDIAQQTQTSMPDVSALFGLIGAAIPGTIAAAMSQMSTLAQATNQLSQDCTIPNCENLSGLGNELNQLLQLFELGALIAFIAEAAADPVGLANDIASIPDALYSGIIQPFLSLVGISL